MRRAFTLRFFRDRRGGWRWQLKHPNGRIMADGGQGYSRLTDAKRGAYRVGRALYAAELGIA